MPPELPANCLSPEPAINPLAQLLKQDTTFIDLRAPAEFARGALPNAVNLPLLTDEERSRVGITFKRTGQHAAIALGHELVSGATRSRRIRGWLDFAQQHPATWLYCWRGGMRSEIAQSWLAAAGTTLPRVTGGFKALRQTCLGVLEEAPGAKPWLIIGGRTGSGKTQLLKRFACGIDLEGIANHRGSAFGAQLSPQPTPVDFENALAAAYLKHLDHLVVLEDESRTIGRLALPQAWHTCMQDSPLLILELDVAARAQNIAREYVSEPLAAGESEAALHSRYSASLQRISKRLGGVRYKDVQSALDAGFANGEHRKWIELLLRWYYDPMYDYQLDRKFERVITRGTAAELAQYIDTHAQPAAC